MTIFGRQTSFTSVRRPIQHFAIVIKRAGTSAVQIVSVAHIEFEQLLLRFFQCDTVAMPFLPPVDDDEQQIAVGKMPD